MPIFEYTCSACKSSFDRLVRSANETAAPACPSCGSTQTSRKLSVFSVGAEQLKSSAAPRLCGRCGQEGPCALGD